MKYIIEGCNSLPCSTRRLALLRGLHLHATFGAITFAATCDACLVSVATTYLSLVSSALSNTETIGSTSQKARSKLEEDAAIEKRS